MVRWQLARDVAKLFPVVVVHRMRSSTAHRGADWLVLDATDQDLSITITALGALLPPAPAQVDINPKQRAPVKRKRGRPAAHEVWPEIITIIERFAGGEGQGETKSLAEEKRRTSTVQLGKSIPQIREHLKREMGDRFPESLSSSTIRRLMVAPHANRRSAVMYKGFIDAKPSSIRNDLRAYNQDAHIANSTVAMLSELCALHNQETLCVSLDTANSLKVGPLATTRRHKTLLFFLGGLGPIVEDHDFPKKGYHIDVSGVLVLTGYLDGQRPGRFTGTDEFGRTRQIYQTCGPSYVFPRAALFHPKTIVVHITNLYTVFKERLLAGETATGDLGQSRWRST